MTMARLEYLVIRAMLMLDMLDFKANKLVFLGYKKNLKDYKLWDLKNREFSREDMSYWMMLRW